MAVAAQSTKPSDDSLAVVQWAERALREQRRELELAHGEFCAALRRRMLEVEPPTQWSRSAALQDEAVRLTPKLQALEGCDRAANASEKSAPPSVSTDPTPILREKSRGSGHSFPQASQGLGHSHSLRSHDVLRTREDVAVGSLFFRIVTGHHFECFFATLIMLNALFMAVEIQYDGMLLGRRVGFRATELAERDQEFWPGFEEAKDFVSLFFGGLFTIEVLAKLIAHHLHFFWSFWNIMDTLIVGLWLLQRGLSIGLPLNPMLLRLTRLIRLLRLLRLVKTVEMFDTLSLMIGAVKMSFSVVLWGAVIVFVIMLMFGLFIQSQMADYIDDASIDEQIRMQMYLYFGTFARTVLTLSELTLGNWVVVSRVLHETVSPYWAYSVMFYRIIVDFSVIKVVTAVIMHETFRCANNDDELMIQTRERAIKKFQEKMTKLFIEADSSGDGNLTRDEFVDVVEDPRVRCWMQAMDLNIRDVDGVFTYLASKNHFKATKLQGDEELSLSDMIAGLSRLRGGAQSCDMLAVLSDCQLMREDIMESTRDLHAAVVTLQRESAQLTDALSAEQAQVKALHEALVTTQNVTLQLQADAAKLEEDAAKLEQDAVTFLHEASPGDPSCPAEKCRL